MSVTKKGYLKGYGTLCYHPNGSEHIVFDQCKKKDRVTYDSELEVGIVQKYDGVKPILRPLLKGIIYSDVKKDIGIVLFHTLDSNISKFSLRLYSEALKARELQDIMGEIPTTNHSWNGV